MTSMLRDRPSSRLGTPSRSPMATPPRSPIGTPIRSPLPWFATTPNRSPIGTRPRSASLRLEDLSGLGMPQRITIMGRELDIVDARTPARSPFPRFATTPSRSPIGTPTRSASPWLEDPSGLGTPQRITIMGRELDITDARTPRNNWGGASPLLSGNVPKEALDSNYLKYNTLSDDDIDDDYSIATAVPMPIMANGNNGGDGEERKKKKKSKRSWILSKLGWKKLRAKWPKGW